MNSHDDKHGQLAKRLSDPEWSHLTNIEKDNLRREIAAFLRSAEQPSKGDPVKAITYAISLLEHGEADKALQYLRAAEERHAGGAVFNDSWVHYWQERAEKAEKLLHSHALRSEPVAWRFKPTAAAKTWAYSPHKPTTVADGEIVEPLYVTPSATGDSERLSWLEQRREGFANIDRITSAGGRFNNLQTLREAIDAAMRSPERGK